MTTDERIEKVENNVADLTKVVYEIQMQQIKDKNELKEIITNTIQNAIEPITKSYNSRITVLEQAKANEALKNQNKLKDLIITGVVTFILGIILSNALDIITHNVNNPNKSEVNIEDVNK